MREQEGTMECTAPSGSLEAEDVPAGYKCTEVSEAELRYGLAIMVSGKRRDGLAVGLERMLGTGFANRILPFDSGAARAYAEIAAARRRMGRPVPEADCQIAAIARSHGMAVAPRNVGDFSDTGIEVIDPWTGA